ncbi:hypothetical protein [Mycolicibacterium sp.]|uniref:hypothetical protein n=1 Tax=Mycolicibacterium sp. TaxID=2320850 RepID=UPI001A2CA54F|nr:hypothetical protein [Mycolicibacterium sp.]MBJ7336190.1 hypothetical protein [Mycolicibacterium sp.]
MFDDRDSAARASIFALSATRIGIGVLAWLKPATTARLFGMRGGAPAESSYLWRLFGVRDVVVGTATLRASGADRRAWVAFGLACDAADGAAAVIGRRDGSLPPSTTALVAVPAAAAGLGAWLLRAGLR